MIYVLLEQNPTRQNWLLRGALFFGCVILLYKLAMHKPNSHLNVRIDEIVNNTNRKLSGHLNSSQTNNDGSPKNSFDGTQKDAISKLITSISHATQKTQLSLEPKKERASQLAFETKIRNLTNCKDKKFEMKIYERGEYWVLEKFIQANHGEMRCTESVTFVTHGDYSHLNNLTAVLKRWLGPMSISLYTSDRNLQATIDSINYLRQCSPSFLVRKFVTFHVFFDRHHLPKHIPKTDEILKRSVDCSDLPPYSNLPVYKNDEMQRNFKYQVNLARIIARDAALTHFLFVCDMLFQPSPGLPEQFLKMIARNETPTNSIGPKIYTLAIFQTNASTNVPWTKTELQGLFKRGEIVQDKNYLDSFPLANKWIAGNETEGLRVFEAEEVKEHYNARELIHIGTNREPYYDDKEFINDDEEMTQVQLMHMLGYKSYLLDNASLVYKPKE